MMKCIRIALAALAIAFALAFSTGALTGFSQVDTAGIRPPQKQTMAGDVKTRAQNSVNTGLSVAMMIEPGMCPCGPKPKG